MLVRQVPTREKIRARNNVHVRGSGTRTILFVHGFGCDQTMWRYVVPAFEQDYRCVLFDYVGSGKSDWSAYDPGRYATLKGYARDVLDVIEAFDLNDVILVGHSVSAVVGLLASLEAPERFDRVVLIGPSPCYINDGDYIGGFTRPDIEGLLDLMDKNYIGWASFLAPVVMGTPNQPELVQELQESFCATDPRLTRAFARATFLSDNREDMGKVRVPALVLQCSEDAIAPESVGQWMARELKGSSYRKLAATGHCPHMSHPAETIQAIKEYLGADAG
ncbi:MAG TPA: alpha/beta hydrolase [Usitatibacter sp.]|nr:alpha/beta hydrolase [Usitatibacter sp.]